MPAILSTIISAFTVVISFFRKIFPWLNGLTNFLGGFFALKSIKIALLLVASSAAVAVVFAFLGLLVSSFISIVNLINMIFSEIRSNPNASCIVYWLNQFGFVDGFNLALPVVLSTLTLIFSLILYRYGSAIAVKLYHIYASIF